MKIFNRREFMRETPRIAAVMGAGLYSSALLASEDTKEQTQNNIAAVLPKPIQVVIDDVGWWSGTDGSKQQEPYRTGIKRNHVPADYQAIVELGASLNIRPQAAMVLCEWDKDNILRKLPTSTWMGENWDNSKWVGPWMEEAAEIIRGNPRNFEFTMHGIGHEYWTGETFTRAEWADNSGVMRPRDQVELHLDYFGRLMDQNKLGDFPKSFVPTAFRHGFGPTEGHDVSLARILKGRGVNYINTPFGIMKNVENVQHGCFGIDAGVMTVDRGHDLFNWNIHGAEFDGEQVLQGATCGMHWPNLLHPDPARNSEIVQGWVNFLAPYNDKPDTMLAPNSVVFQRQLAHFVCTKFKHTGKSVELDFTETDTLPDEIGKKELTLKVKSPEPLRFKASGIKIVSESEGKQQGALLYTLKLERTKGKKSARVDFINAS